VGERREEPAVTGRLALVVNPAKIEDLKGLVDLLATAAADAGWQPPLVLETTPDDAGTGQARHGLARGVDLVVAAGGDGTVRAVCQALAGSGTPLAIVPAGTGNLLARNLGIPLQTPDAVEVCFVGRDRLIDVGLLTSTSHSTDEPGTANHPATDDGEVFAVMTGMGFDAAMMEEVPERLKGRLGWPAYVIGGIRGLRRHKPRVTVEVDGTQVARRRVRTVLVANVGTLQGGVALLPDAACDDGLLDVCLVVPRLTRRWTQRHQGRDVLIRATRPEPRQLDGEPVTDGVTVHARVLPGALLLRVPAAPEPAKEP
jgi:diacylglycerol kinase family enzyme